MHERGAQPGRAVSCPKSGAPGSRRPVRAALLASDVAVAATVGDVAEFGHIDMDHRARVRVLVTVHGLTRDSRDERQPVDPTPHEDSVHGRGGKPQQAGDLNRPHPLAPPQRDDLAFEHFGGLVR
jgi:hypothetical protein